MSHLADLVSAGSILADVGTDHGYIPIYLLQAGKIRHAFAMDIRQEPLQRAKENGRAYGLDADITFLLSDGLAALAPGDANAILAAGMGGGVILHILETGRSVIALADEVILQPQSEIVRVRQYLHENGFTIDREDLVCEDGKYYPMIHAIPQSKDGIERGNQDFDRMEWEIWLRYGEIRLNGRNPAFWDYLWHQAHAYEAVLEQLKKSRQTKQAMARKEEIAAELFWAKAALEYQRKE